MSWGKIVLILLFFIHIGTRVAVIPARHTDPTAYLIVMSGASVYVFLGGLWEMRRGTFRWYPEGAIFMITWLILFGISFSTLYEARGHHAMLHQAKITTLSESSPAGPLASS